MEAPIIQTEIEGEVIFSPKDYLNYKKDTGNMKIPDIPNKCILCFEPSFIEFAKDNMNIEEIKWFRTEFKIYRVISKDIIIVSINYGAALSAIALEELIALGVKDFIVLGSAGTLQKDIPLGSLVICERAIREEGVSYHYLKPSKYVSCSEILLEKSKQVLDNIDISTSIGTSWSTDSFYRETKSKTIKYQNENVLCVEMEAAGLYAVCDYRNVNILSIFYISDSIAELKWNPNFHLSNPGSNRKIMFDIAFKILKEE
tara:strand:+ start:277 stop:1050 length:774 start_codon:yes stop_codon:yes gene_type:complete